MASWIKPHPKKPSSSPPDTCVIRPSNSSLSLQFPYRLTVPLLTVRWKVKLISMPTSNVILKWKDGSTNYGKFARTHFNNRVKFIEENVTLLIKPAQRNDTGSYSLETDDKFGVTTTIHFKVTILDPVKEPRVQVKSNVLTGGLCQVVLNCQAPRDGNLSFQWYQDSMQMPVLMNDTPWEVEVIVKSSHNYTCRVSNEFSSANHSLRLDPSCLDPSKMNLSSPAILVTLGVIILLLGSLACFLVWRRRGKRRKQSESIHRTVYEDVNNPRNRNQVNQKPGQNSSEDTKTIYSTVQIQVCFSSLQSSASTSGENSNTLYSLVQPSRKSVSKKKQPSPSLNYTVHEEVGNGKPRALGPSRLSLKEVQNFQIYS
ncbi:natural killer cell receptor 2B4 isoform X2 [Erinaceus europaeus]|uniref:Natural killer cell receptor 2B4 isoform X2 n=1 Tax=Erinaceus europaeus TaxID=9365 RepID=A0ABM3XXT4_ERIEU|nr:natural killer cell receptor 2B4 isoform X2 [Erinaceus europaeus]